MAYSLYYVSFHWPIDDLVTSVKCKRPQADVRHYRSNAEWRETQRTYYVYTAFVSPCILPSSVRLHSIFGCNALPTMKLIKCIGNIRNFVARPSEMAHVDFRVYGIIKIKLANTWYQKQNQEQGITSEKNKVSFTVGRHEDKGRDTSLYAVYIKFM
jgi:hypothetical protein